MKKIIFVTMVSLLTMSSCSTYTGNGAITGGMFGAMIGSSIGGISGGWRGSDVGQLVGMAGGAVVGAAIGREKETRGKNSAIPSGTGTAQSSPPACLQL